MKRVFIPYTLVSTATTGTIWLHGSHCTRQVKPAIGVGSLSTPSRGLFTKTPIHHKEHYEKVEKRRAAGSAAASSSSSKDEKDSATATTNLGKSTGGGGGGVAVAPEPAPHTTTTTTAAAGISSNDHHHHHSRTLVTKKRRPKNIRKHSTSPVAAPRVVATTTTPTAAPAPPTIETQPDRVHGRSINLGDSTRAASMGTGSVQQIDTISQPTPAAATTTTTTAAATRAPSTSVPRSSKTNSSNNSSRLNTKVDGSKRSRASSAKATATATTKTTTTAVSAGGKTAATAHRVTPSTTKVRPGAKSARNAKGKEQKKKGKTGKTTTTASSSSSAPTSGANNSSAPSSLHTNRVQTTEDMEEAEEARIIAERAVATKLFMISDSMASFFSILPFAPKADVAKYIREVNKTNLDVHHYHQQQQQQQQQHSQTQNVSSVTSSVSAAPLNAFDQEKEESVEGRHGVLPDQDTSAARHKQSAQPNHLADVHADYYEDIRQRVLVEDFSNHTLSIMVRDLEQLVPPPELQLPNIYHAMKQEEQRKGQAPPPPTQPEQDLSPTANKEKTGSGKKVRKMKKQLAEAAAAKVAPTAPATAITLSIPERLAALQQWQKEALQYAEWTQKRYSRIPSYYHAITRIFLKSSAVSTKPSLAPNERNAEPAVTATKSPAGRKGKSAASRTPASAKSADVHADDAGESNNAAADFTVIVHGAAGTKEASDVLAALYRSIRETDEVQPLPSSLLTPTFSASAASTASATTADVGTNPSAADAIDIRRLPAISANIIASMKIALAKQNSRQPSSSSLDRDKDDDSSSTSLTSLLRNVFPEGFPPSSPQQQQQQDSASAEEEQEPSADGAAAQDTEPGEDAFDDDEKDGFDISQSALGVSGDWRKVNHRCQTSGISSDFNNISRSLDPEHMEEIETKYRTEFMLFSYPFAITPLLTVHATCAPRREAVLGERYDEKDFLRDYFSQARPLLLPPPRSEAREEELLGDHLSTEDDCVAQAPTKGKKKAASSHGGHKKFNRHCIAIPPLPRYCTRQTILIEHSDESLHPLDLITMAERFSVHNKKETKKSGAHPAGTPGGGFESLYDENNKLKKEIRFQLRKKNIKIHCLIVDGRKVY